MLAKLVQVIAVDNAVYQSIEDLGRQWGRSSTRSMCSNRGQGEIGHRLPLNNRSSAGCFIAN